jgi:UDP-glucose 4-epimerase
VKVLVTGGAGFIGANLCRHLVGDDQVDEVRVLDDLSTGRADNIEGLDLDMRIGDLADPALMTAAASGVDAIVHLGARPSVPRSIQDPMASHHANVNGTVAVLEAARAAGTPVVYASSSSVYGDTEVLPKHEGLPVAPRSPYAAGKLAGEAYALAYQHAYGLPVLALRFFNVYGPLQAADHDYAAVVPRFVDAALAGRPLQVHGDGRQSRDFTFVDTVVAVLAAAATTGRCAEGPVNLAFGTRTDLLDLIARLEAVLGHEVEVEHTDPRPGDVRHSTASGERLEALFPDVTPVDLDTGLRATVDWFRGLSAG